MPVRPHGRRVLDHARQAAPDGAARRRKLAAGRFRTTDRNGGDESIAAREACAGFYGQDLQAMGYQRLKLFPAAVLGSVKLLQALQGPLPELKFCPTGGVTAANASHYLQLPNVMCVGGTWLTPIDAIR